MIDILRYVFINIILIIIILIIWGVTYKTTCDKEKQRPFERGFEPAGGTRIQFCIKFFLIGILFLIFDVEVRLIIPLPYRQTFLLIFLIILIMGLVYEWYYGGLEWLYVNRRFTGEHGVLVCWFLASPLINIRSQSYVISNTTHKEMNNEDSDHIILHRSESWDNSYTVGRFVVWSYGNDRSLGDLRIAIKDQASSIPFLRGRSSHQDVVGGGLHVLNLAKDCTYHNPISIKYKNGLFIP